MSNNPIHATVFIPVFNGEKYLKELLNSLYSQYCEFSFEVLIIDSGSSDSSLSIIQDFPQVRLHQIPNSEFGHGKTRNLAVSLARGEFIVFLTQDAIPASTNWLNEILHPFSLRDDVVGVLGKQIPRQNAIPSVRYDIEMMFRQQGANQGWTLFNLETIQNVVPENSRLGINPEYDRLYFYSDVNSAARRSFLSDKIPYRDVKYAEDQMFCKDFIDAGYSKIYAPAAAVIHSNDFTLSEFGPRIFDETVGLRKIGFEVPPVSLATMSKGIIVGTLGTVYRSAKDKRFPISRRLADTSSAFLYEITKWLNLRKASKIDLHAFEEIEANSLESRKKKDGA